MNNVAYAANEKPLAADPGL